MKLYNANSYEEAVQMAAKIAEVSPWKERFTFSAMLLTESASRSFYHQRCPNSVTNNL